MALKDIVVGLDGSTPASDALRWAWGLADDLSGSVRAISTWQLPLEPTMTPVVGAMPSQAFMANHCAEMLDKALAESGVADIDSEVREGEAGRVLAAESALADLVVVGRTGNGHSGVVRRLTEMVLGSVARYVVHHAQGPVAAIPPEQVWTTDPTVVVGIDGSEASVAALRWAVANLPDTARIHAVRAVPPAAEGLLAFDHQALNRILERVDAELHEAIAEALEPLGAAVDIVTPVVLVDHPRYALMSPGFDVDMIVVGERGRGALSSRLLGSIADHVVRYAPCPVVVIPSDTKDEA